MKPLQQWWKLSPKITFLVIFSMFLIVGLLKLDKDFGWHLMSGDYIVRHGVPRTDVFTYTAQDFPWINHEWLNDVLVYLIYTTGGLGLLAVIWASLGTAALWLVGRRFEAGTVLLAAVAVAPFAGVRPLVWTLLGLAVGVFVVHRPKFWWGLPMLFALWANLHGGFLLGLMYVLYRAVRLRSLKLCLVMLVSFVATACNPYGFVIYVEIFRTITDGSLHSTIGEWASFNVIYTIWPLGLVWLVGFVLFSAKQRKEYLRFDVAMLAAGLSSVRNWPLFALFSMERVDEYLRRIGKLFPVRMGRSQRFVVYGLVTGLVIFSLGCFVASCYSIAKERQGFPADAVAYLKKNPCSGRLFAFYDYGGYMIWQLPGHPVFIDGRMPSWQKPAGGSYLQDYLRIGVDEVFRRQEFEKYNIRCVLMPSNEPIVTQLKADKWQVVLLRNEYLLLKR